MSEEIERQARAPRIQLRLQTVGWELCAIQMAAFRDDQSLGEDVV